MADEVREYVRAAQAAELRGDKAAAVEMLRKAAALYRSAGNQGRALQMLRHARRLDDSRQDVADELRRLEWIPERPLQQAISPDEDGEEERRALGPLDAVDTGSIVADKQLFERGPALADPALQAWCSFCCRPAKESGRLVAGPAGAFICLSCVRASFDMLAPEEATDPQARPKDERTQLRPPPFEELSSWDARATEPMPARQAEALADAAARVLPPKSEEPPATAVPWAAREPPLAPNPPAQESKGAESAAPSTPPGALDLARSTEPAPAASPGVEELARPLESTAPADLASAIERGSALHPPAESSAAEAPVELVAQAEACSVIEAGFRLSARVLLLIGPEGSGKTTCLRGLARAGKGRYHADISQVPPGPHEEPILVEVHRQLSEEEAAKLVALVDGKGGRQLVLAIRGDPPRPALGLRGDEAELPLFTTRDLLQATQGRLPAALASRVQVVAPFRPLVLEELAEVARRLIVRRAAEIDLSEELLAALAEEALRSGRNGREVEALLDRIPAGSWGLAEGARPKRRRRKKAESEQP
ncbi:MAG: hypothetical protein HYZ28_15485 [Myxococcales bacterium]|nr:hypothetical protein [Myxococcales bacterium]